MGRQEGDQTPNPLLSAMESHFHSYNEFRGTRVERMSERCCHVSVSGLTSFSNILRVSLERRIQDWGEGARSWKGGGGDSNFEKECEAKLAAKFTVGGRHLEAGSWDPLDLLLCGSEHF